MIMKYNVILKEKGKNIKKTTKNISVFQNILGNFLVIIISPTDTNLILEGSDEEKIFR